MIAVVIHMTVRTALALVLLFLAVACGSSQMPPPKSSQIASSARDTPTVNASASTASSSRLTPPSPSPIPVSAVTFSCRLPVIAGSNPSRPAFISFPGATLSYDSTTPTIPQPPGQPGPGGFYDLRFQKWLPVSRPSVSPDGTSYVWVSWLPDQTTASVIHLVNVATGSDRAIPLTGFPLVPVVMDFDGRTVFIDSGYEGPPSGLWTLDTASSALTRIANIPFVQAYDPTSGVVWLGGVALADPDPPQEIEGAGSDELIRHELSTGATLPWFYSAGKEVLLLGLDGSGSPIVQISGDLRTNGAGVEVRIVSAPGVSQVIGSLQGELWGPSADSHGVWFRGPGGIYLYRVAEGLRRVWGGEVGAIAGECL